MSVTHTPGPWLIDGAAMPLVYTDRPSKWSGIRKGEIARVAGMGNADNAQQQANARLIAAAPELLAASIEAVQHIEQLADMVQTLAKKLGLGRKVRAEDFGEKARAAIAKAKGA